MLYAVIILSVVLLGVVALFLHEFRAQRQDWLSSMEALEGRNTRLRRRNRALETELNDSTQGRKDLVSLLGRTTSELEDAYTCLNLVLEDGRKQDLIHNPVHSHDDKVDSAILSLDGLRRIREFDVEKFDRSLLPFPKDGQTPKINHVALDSMVLDDATPSLKHLAKVIPIDSINPD